MSSREWRQIKFGCFTAKKLNSIIANMMFGLPKSTDSAIVKEH